METRKISKEPQRGYIELEREICSDAYEFLEQLLQMQFRRRSNRWATVLHLDGTRDKDGKPTTVVYENTPNLAYDYGRQRGERIPFLMVQRGLATDYHDAIRILCQATGRDVPQLSEEIKQRIQQEQQRREAIALMSQQFSQAQPTDAAKMALDYLLKRGWSGTEASAAGLGVATDEALMLLYPDGGGISYRGWLSMPIYQADRLAGVKFRNTNKKEYINTDFEKSEKLAYIPGHVASGTVVVVEGELDALHAKVKTDAALQHHWQTMSTDDIYPVVATEGGPISDRQLSDAISRGVKQFILALDNDKEGPGFTDISAKRIRQAGCQAYVMQYPDGVKDLDEWFGHKKDGKLYFGFDELREAESNVVSWYQWKALRAYQETQTSKNKALAQGQFIDMARNMLQDDTITAYDRHNLYQALRELDDIPGLDTLLKEDAEITKNKAIGETLRKLGDATIKGSEFLIRKLKKQLADLQGNRAKVDAREAAAESQSLALFDAESPESPYIDTPYSLELDGRSYSLKIATEALTVIAARSNHGKSAALLAMVVHCLNDKHEGAVLLFITEKSRRNTMPRLINIYARTNGFGEAEARQDIDEALKSGRLKVYRQRDVETVCDIARNVARETTVKACIVDYVQMMQTGDYAFGDKKTRMETACSLLENLCHDTNSAVIAGAQLSRQCTSPTTMNENDIADAVEIEQFADAIYLLWASHKKPIADKATAQDICDEMRLKGVILGQPGRMYVKCAKSRQPDMPNNAEAVWEYVDDTLKQGTTAQQPKAASTTKEFKKARL